MFLQEIMSEANDCVSGAYPFRICAWNRLARNFALAFLVEKKEEDALIIF